MISVESRAAVSRRANYRCEYCLFRQDYSAVIHHIEHIVSKQHGGTDDLDNLALACSRCNLLKGPNLSAVDPITGEILRLFHPRNQEWKDHFVFVGAQIVGLTASGRATIQLLRMNDKSKIDTRQAMIERGHFLD